MGQPLVLPGATMCNQVLTGVTRCCLVLRAHLVLRQVHDAHQLARAGNAGQQHELVRASNLPQKNSRTSNSTRRLHATR